MIPTGLTQVPPRTLSRWAVTILGSPERTEESVQGCHMLCASVEGTQEDA
jgi:hypothetical protein